MKLRLIADSYDQLRKDEPGARVDQRRKGDLFEPRDQAEYDRLTSLGVAEDPEQAQQRAREELDRRREQLEAEKDRLEAELAQVDDSDPGQLKGKQLDAALEDRGLSTEGTAGEKRQRLAAHVADNPPG